MPWTAFSMLGDTHAAYFFNFSPGFIMFCVCRPLAMSHVLVKWVGEETWDVYLVRAVVDTQMGFRLLSKESAITELRGQDGPHQLEKRGAARTCKAVGFQ